VANDYGGCGDRRRGLSWSGPQPAAAESARATDSGHTAGPGRNACRSGRRRTARVQPGRTRNGVRIADPAAFRPIGTDASQPAPYPQKLGAELRRLVARERYCTRGASEPDLAFIGPRPRTGSVRGRRPGSPVENFLWIRRTPDRHGCSGGKGAPTCSGHQHRRYLGDVSATWPDAPAHAIAVDGRRAPVCGDESGLFFVCRFGPVSPAANGR